MPHVTVTMELPNKLIASLRDELDQQDKNIAARSIMNVMRGMLSPSELNRGYMRSCIASACATGTFTCAVASVVNNTDKVTIGGIELAVKASPANDAQFAKGATDAECALNLANAINTEKDLSKLVRATAVADVVTVTAIAPGPVGNLITLAETGNGFTKSGTALSGGASDEVDGYEFGYTPTT